MATVRDLLEASLRKIGVVAAGETPAAEDINDAKEAMNALIESWSTENLIIPYKVRETFTLTSGDGTVTFGGSGADITTSRPQRVEQAAIMVSGQEMPMLVATKEQWASITTKTTTSDVPTVLYPEYTDTYITMNLWPVPSAANTLVLYSWKPLTTYTNLSTTLTLQPGYERALIWNVAIEVASEYGREPTPTMVQNAIESKANVKRMNSKPRFLTCDEAVLEQNPPFNWLSGGFDL